jgi:hypothetical protein
MAGGWSGGLTFGNARAVGNNLATSSPLTLVSGSSPFTKGAWTQVLSATTADTAWILVQCDGDSGGGVSFAYDLGIGPSGSEVTIVSNLVSSQDGVDNTVFMFPLSIPAGTRIAARCSSDAGADSGQIKALLFDDIACSAHAGSVVDTYGFNAATNNGVTVDPGAAANSPGAYAQITGSTTNDLAGFFLAFDGQGLTGGSGVRIRLLVDVAVGPSGSESIILPQFGLIYDSYGSPIHLPETTPYIPIQIRVGARIAVRAQANSAVAPDRKIGVTFYGVRQ